MEYNFREIEKKWHEYWIANKVYKVEKNADKPKYYVLDMFPYPSGAGLHVGHPLGYIASDIYSRYKRWATMPTDCRQNNMPSKPVSILK